MEPHNIARTLSEGERVTSLYADTYFNDSYCETKKPSKEIIKQIPKKKRDKFCVPVVTDTWKSPSDLLIGIIDLTPPFTSKITRGKTHEGILAIGDSILEQERDRFAAYVSKLMEENDAAWTHILDHEKSVVAKKVKAIYQEILVNKSKTLMTEINAFYESTLQDLEDHMRKEVNDVLVSAHANIVSDLNTEIQDKLKKEKVIVKKVLQQRYDSEVKKIKHYYKLILDHENYKNTKLINQALHERNDAIKAFYKQIEAENTVSTMYVMCTERKKCRIKQFLLDNYHGAEIAEKLQKIKERQEVLDAIKAREKHISEINKQWEEKIKKLLQLFLKFVSFSLKLLPEQTTFLLDLEKMVVLQLNEIQKSPTKTQSILVDEEIYNSFKFEEAESEMKDKVCDKDPIVVIGDTSDSIPTPHGSRESLASDVDLPMIRLQRKFIYAKCDNFDDVKALLESQRCKCMNGPPKPLSPAESPQESNTTSTTKSATTVESESSLESLVIENINILQNCPVRRCSIKKKESFPDLDTYADFTEENYKRVKAITGKLPETDAPPELIHPRDIVQQELPFSVTKEKYHHVETQYSSQEDITVEPLTCLCTDEVTAKLDVTPSVIKESESEKMNKIMMKRKASLLRVVHEHPNLLKLFTDEAFDFIYTIK